MRIKKALIAMVVSCGSVGVFGVAGAAPGPTMGPGDIGVKVSTDVRYQPPKEEIVVDVAVTGVGAETLQRGVRVFVDRHGSPDGQWAVGVATTKDGQDDTFYVFDITGGDGGLFSQALDAIDAVCDGTGIC